MGIEMKDPANFSPSVEIPAKVDSFRFWCQKVLPLVYDDSLSYYELLCKVVDYLNNTIADVNTLGTDVDNLNKAYNELQSYVNDYFSTLDVQNEINNKLDVMAQDGSLSALIQPLFDTYKTEINNEVNQQNNKIGVLENRMNTFTSLPSGSTTGDAELIDIRVPASGFNNNEPFANAGDAVRGQVSSLKSDITNSLYGNINYGNTITNDITNSTSGIIYNGAGIEINIDKPLTEITVDLKAKINGNVKCVIFDHVYRNVLAESELHSIDTNLTSYRFTFDKELNLTGILLVMFVLDNMDNVIYYAFNANGLQHSNYWYKEVNAFYYMYFARKMINNDKNAIIKANSNNQQGMQFTISCYEPIDAYKEINDIKKNKSYKMNYIYVSKNGNDTTGDGSIYKPYATIYHANETITDNSENNRYTIIVGNGTYTDLQEKYAGTFSKQYEGVVCKSYVYYTSETPLEPDKTVIKWDGATGFTKPITNEEISDKTPFHITKSIDTAIIGFKFECKNLRYCAHIETVNPIYGAVNFKYENCIFEWGGIPDVSDFTHPRPNVGMGTTYYERGIFRNCIFNNTNPSTENGGNHLIIQTHDNTLNPDCSIKIGENIKVENCKIIITDGSPFVDINLRNKQSQYDALPLFELKNINSLPINIIKETNNSGQGANVIFECTKEYTNN